MCLFKKALGFLFYGDANPLLTTCVWTHQLWKHTTRLQGMCQLSAMMSRQINQKMFDGIGSNHRLDGNETCLSHEDNLTTIMRTFRHNVGRPITAWCFKETAIANGKTVTRTKTCGGQAMPSYAKLSLILSKNSLRRWRWPKRERYTLSVLTVEQTLPCNCAAPATNAIFLSYTCGVHDPIATAGTTRGNDHAKSNENKNPTSTKRKQPHHETLV